MAWRLSSLFSFLILLLGCTNPQNSIDENSQGEVLIQQNEIASVKDALKSESFTLITCDSIQSAMGIIVKSVYTSSSSVKIEQKAQHILSEKFRKNWELGMEQSIRDTSEHYNKVVFEFIKESNTLVSYILKVKK